MKLQLKYILLLTLFGSLMACTGPKDPNNGENKGYSGKMSDYENFDAGAFPERSANNNTPVTVTHDVPETLMRKDTQPPVINPTPPVTPPTDPKPPATGATRAGFRVQIYASSTREGADAKRRELLQWWASNKSGAPTVLGKGDLPIYVPQQQGLFKVRVGNFVNRQDADQAAAFLRRKFSDIFIVPDTVIY